MKKHYSFLLLLLLASGAQAQQVSVTFFDLSWPTQRFANDTFNMLNFLLATFANAILDNDLLLATETIKEMQELDVSELTDKKFHKVLLTRRDAIIQAFKSNAPENYLALAVEHIAWYLNVAYTSRSLSIIPAIISRLKDAPQTDEIKAIIATCADLATDARRSNIAINSYFGWIAGFSVGTWIGTWLHKKEAISPSKIAGVGCSIFLTWLVYRITRDETLDHARFELLLRELSPQKA